MRTAVVFAGFAFVAGACSHGPSHAEKAALKAVSASDRGQGFAELFPSKPKKEACGIPMGGPAPGRSVPGTCETDVTTNPDGSAAVSFRASWDRNDFHAQPGSSRRRTQSHVWTFVVAKNGTVARTSEQGDVPPQYIP
jgi:hypothetical protein